MKVRSALAAFALVTAVAAGQSMAQQKVAIANPIKILTEAQETKDFNATINAEQADLRTQEQQKIENLKSLKAKLDQIKPDAPQWNEINKQMVEARNNYQTWKQQADMDLAHKFREHMKKMSGKINDAVAAIAKDKGYDLVLAEQKPEVSDQQMEQLNPQQIIQVMFSRNVLFSGESIDLTQQVIEKLNATYKPSK